MAPNILIRVVQNSANSEGKTPGAGSNSISTCNSFSSNGSNVTEKTQSMIQASSRNFDCLRSDKRLRPSGMTTLFHGL